VHVWCVRCCCYVWCSLVRLRRAVAAREALLAPPSRNPRCQGQRDHNAVPGRFFAPGPDASRLDLTKNTLRSEGREVQIKQRSEGLGLQQTEEALQVQGLNCL
jgi:hypothetical protein